MYSYVSKTKTIAFILELGFVIILFIFSVNLMDAPIAARAFAINKLDGQKDIVKTDKNIIQPFTMTNWINEYNGTLNF